MSAVLADPFASGKRCSADLTQESIGAQIARRVKRWWLIVLMACGAPVMPVPDSGMPVHDAGTPPPDAGTPDAGTPYTPPVVAYDHSLFWTDPALLDDASLISFAKLMQAAAGSGNGGPLLQQWFNRFRTSFERDQPATFLYDFAKDAGSDPSQWDLSRLQFKLTGVHNRIDKADSSAGGNCGELRASVTSLEPELQQFHMLFIFGQPAGAGDTAADGHVSCEATARRWAALSELDGGALLDAVRGEFTRGFVPERFALIETVEQTISPWEWRQWTPADGGLDNPLLFQQADAPALNMPGQRRDDFLRWVTANAPALNARTLLVPQEFRAPIIQVQQGVARTPLSLDGVDAGVLTQFPQLRQNIELMGCAACHTADAEFLQTADDRTPSSFYKKELTARERNLESLARGESPVVPYGPLQQNPVLPP
jgi:hypothetical protein